MSIEQNSMKTPPAVLSVAGSDPSGGAGIQADLKTFARCGVYGAAAITAITVQNTLGVCKVIPVDPGLVAEQVRAVLTDLRISVVKIGMITGIDTARAVAPLLEGVTVVWDPVMKSSSMDSLATPGSEHGIAKEILQTADFITPNKMELELLSGRPGIPPADAAAFLLEKYASLSGVIVTGGHFSPAKTFTDTLVLRKPDDQNKNIITQTHPRIETKNTHGTGCTFASAFAAALAKGKDPAAAFRFASELTCKLIAMSASWRMGSGSGPLLHHL